MNRTREDPCKGPRGFCSLPFLFCNLLTLYLYKETDHDALRCSKLSHNWQVLMELKWYAIRISVI